MFGLANLKRIAQKLLSELFPLIFGLVCPGFQRPKLKAIPLQFQIFEPKFFTPIFGLRGRSKKSTKINFLDPETAGGVTRRGGGQEVGSLPCFP